MDSYFSKYQALLKIFIVFSLLFWFLMCASPASAASSKESNPSIGSAPVQLAYYTRYHRNVHHRVKPYHRYNNRHYHHRYYR